MPTAEEILRSATEVANQWVPLAIAWHLAIAAIVGAVALGWRPGRRTTGLLLASLCASVAVISILARNPFNASIFAALTGLLLVVARRLSSAPPAMLAPAWAIAVGWLLVGFGLVYPHFLRGSAAMYLVAAPVGVVPCPTLAVVIGFSLLAAGLQSRAWCWVLVTAGAFYGIVGVVQLGVVLDIGLLAGTAALALLAQELRGTRRQRRAGATGQCAVGRLHRGAGGAHP